MSNYLIRLFRHEIVLPHDLWCYSFVVYNSILRLCVQALRIYFQWSTMWRFSSLFYFFFFPSWFLYIFDAILVIRLAELRWQASRDSLDQYECTEQSEPCCLLNCSDTSFGILSFVLLFLLIEVWNAMYYFSDLRMMRHANWARSILSTWRVVSGLMLQGPRAFAFRFLLVLSLSIKRKWPLYLVIWLFICLVIYSLFF